MMKLLYIIIATLFGILEGAFPYHWHGFVKRSGKDKKTYSEIIRELTPLFIVREYFLNISLSIVGWVAGYYLFFNRSVFHGNSVYVVAAVVLFLLGATGYLPYFVVTRLGSLKG
jgi:hypothetical protein